jgi:hypothetical protein
MRIAGNRGQGMLEFVFATLLALSIILGVIQLALVFNAHNMVKLAAFNAARAAIVARDDNPEEPVKFQQMVDKARIAAFITLLPVIPDLHGILPDSLANTPSSLQNLLGLNAGNPAAGGALGVFAERAVGVIMEYLAITVKFVRVDQDGDADAMTAQDFANMDPGRGRVEFDDRDQADNNLLKVVVSWNYPLVVPFANRIFFAAGNPQAYALTWIAAHPQYAKQNPLTTVRLLAGDPTAIPVWGLGLEFESFINKVSGGGLLGDFLRRTMYRWRMRQTYIMRMQWDRTS